MTAMSPEAILQLRKTIYNAFDPEQEQPVVEGDDRYVPIYPEASDPIVELHDKVRFKKTGGIHLFSGCRGSGKTTQLNRLKKRLSAEGYYVVTIDALEYLNPAEPVEASDMLIVLAASLSQTVSADLGIDPAKEGYWSKFWNFLTTTEVKIDEFGLSAGTEEFQASFKASFREKESLRARLRTYLANRLSEFRDETHDFIAIIAEKLAKKKSSCAGFVLILDQFEQLRGDLTNADKVIESVLRIFTHHLDLLKLPGWQSIYTVPPWLHLANPGSVNFDVFLPCVKLWKRPDSSAKAARRDETGWTTMRSLVEKRIAPANLTDLFGPPDVKRKHAVLELLVLNSGGHFRDLFLLVSKCVLAARKLPITKAHAEQSIASLTSSKPISDADSLLLREIHLTHQLCLPNNDPKTVLHFARLLDHHLILEFRNGKPWFDIHPAIVEMVETTAARVEARRATSVTTE